MIKVDKSIDQESNYTRAANIDKLLEVFVIVLDEKCRFCIEEQAD